jgi:hypothetical protein
MRAIIRAAVQAALDDVAAIVVEPEQTSAGAERSPQRLSKSEAPSAGHLGSARAH